MKAKKGKVILIGAGPGDAGLVTVKAVHALKTADVVLYDRLVSLSVLAMAPLDAQFIDVGKSTSNHTIPQEDINRIILDYAMQGKTVIRLKGGDPYLFGRGAEELDLILQHGIDFEEIPGITSAVAVPAYGGIPVTHRDNSSSLHIITAHAKKNGEVDIAYSELVSLGGTLVFMMGVSQLENICSGLIAAGIPESTPMALVHRGTTSRQRTLVSTVGEITSEAKRLKFAAPSVIVVGDVCSYSSSLNWFERQPLFNTSVVVTQPHSAKSKLASQLRELGCTVTELPMIATKPVPMPKKIADALADYSWIVFTSIAGVESFIEAISEHKVDIRKIGAAKIAAVGSSTAEGLRKIGIIADFVPDIFTADHLADGLVKRVKKGERVLLYRSAIGRDVLPERLTDMGALVDDIAAYDTEIHSTPADHLALRIMQGEADLIAFTSGSSVAGFAALMGENTDLSSVQAVCIGELTAKAAGELGMQVTVSDEATINSMVQKIQSIRCDVI